MKWIDFLVYSFKNSRFQIKFLIFLKKICKIKTDLLLGLSRYYIRTVQIIEFFSFSLSSSDLLNCKRFSLKFLDAAATSCSSKWYSRFFMSNSTTSRTFSLSPTQQYTAFCQIRFFQILVFFMLCIIHSNLDIVNSAIW